MQSAFPIVVFAVTVVGGLGALVALVLNRRTWEEYGKHHLTLDSEPSQGTPGGLAAPNAERDAEIRQLLDARNARRRRRGEPEVDVEQELARLMGPQIDDELRAEIRDLVIARNARRARRGQPPLDVEAEIEREIAGLTGI